MERSFRFGRRKWLIINGRVSTPGGVSFRFVPLAHAVNALRVVMSKSQDAVVLRPYDWMTSR